MLISPETSSPPRRVFDAQISQLQPPTVPLRLWVSSLTLALAGGFQFGYNLVITNPAQSAFIKFLNESASEPMSDAELNRYWPLIVSLLYFGGIFGALCIRIAADSLGRKRAIYLTTIGQTIFCVLAIASYFLQSSPLYAFSRFVLGICQAMSLGIAPLFISEASPTHIRGRISLSTGIAVQLAIVIGSVMGMPQVFGDRWYHLYTFELVTLLPALLIIPFIPESPSYLVAQGYKDDAVKSVMYYHGGDTNYAFVEISKLLDNAHSSSAPVGLWEVLLNKSHRQPILGGAMVMLAMISSGVVVINGYAVAILQEVGLSIREAAWSNIGISLLTVLGAIVSSFFIDRYGRRPLLLITLFGVLIINISIVSLMFLFELTKNLLFGQLLVLSICCYALLFSAGPAPLSFFISAELCSHSIRGSAMAWANVVNAVYRSIVLAIFPPLVSLYGTATVYFILFLPISAFALVYLYLRLPETKPKNELISEEKQRPSI